MNKQVVKISLISLTFFIAAFVAVKSYHGYTQMRTRTLGMTAALVKEKSFDGKRKAFSLLLNLKVARKDLFKFNERVQFLRNDFYTLVTNKRGDVRPEDSNTLEQMFKEDLSSNSVISSDIHVIIQSKQ